jgi:hypothetical protein
MSESEIAPDLSKAVISTKIVKKLSASPQVNHDLDLKKIKKAIYITLQTATTNRSSLEV